MKKIIIIGASGHGKVVADIAVKNGYENITFFDDDETLKECAGFPVVGCVEEAKYCDGDKIVAIGDAKVRENIQSSLTNIVSLIHPDAVISRRVKIGTGSVVMAGVIINSDVVIGDGCIINTGASIDHDCRIGDYSHVSVGAHLAGTISIGARTWIGIGSIVSNDLSICGDCMIGAGSVVIKNIEKPGTYFGVPVKGVRN